MRGWATLWRMKKHVIWSFFDRHCCCIYVSSFEISAFYQYFDCILVHLWSRNKAMLPILRYFSWCLRWNDMKLYLLAWHMCLHKLMLCLCLQCLLMWLRLRLLSLMVYLLIRRIFYLYSHIWKISSILHIILNSFENLRPTCNIEDNIIICYISSAIWFEKLFLYLFLLISNIFRRNLMNNQIIL